MSSFYYELWPREIDRDLDVGKEITITPELREYSGSNEDDYDILPGDQTDFEVETYDEKAYTITDNEDGTYTLKRLQKYDTSFRIRAFAKNENEEYEEVDDVEYRLNERNYDFWYEIEGSDAIYSDGSRTFGFNLDNLEGVDF